MAREASTTDNQRATPVRAILKEYRRVRGRGLLLIPLILILAVVAGLVYLGLNPPSPVAKPVEKVLPNDKFQVK